MKRCMVVDVRKSVDKNTNDKVIWLTMYCLAKKTKEGNLWHTKKDQSLIYACINATRNNEEYQRFEDINPGTLVDVTLGVNDYEKVFVQTLDIVPNTNFLEPKDLYL